MRFIHHHNTTKQCVSLQILTGASPHRAILAIWTNIDGYAATNTANPYYGTACMWQCLVCVWVLCYAHIQSKLTDWSSNVYIQVLKVSIMGCALIMKPIWGGDNYKRLLFWYMVCWHTVYNEQSMDIIITACRKMRTDLTHIPWQDAIAVWTNSSIL